MRYPFLQLRGWNGVETGYECLAHAIEEDDALIEELDHRFHAPLGSGV